MDLRKQSILDLAHKSFSESRLSSEQKIDASFIFRFELGWVQWVDQIRSLIRQLANLEGDDLLPSAIASKMWVHLEMNQDIAIVADNGMVGIISGESPYAPFDNHIKEEYTKITPEALRSNQDSITSYLPQVVAEAELTSYVQSEILRLARVYQIVPLGEDEWDKFPMEKIELNLINLRNYLILGEPLPSFIWPNIRFIESKTGEGVIRTLRPHNLYGRSLADAESDKPRLKKSTRIRTWAVYFLTKRGGGDLSETRAVDEWNIRFKDSLDERNFRANRFHLLKQGSKSG